MIKNTYLVATIKPWHVSAYQRRTPDFPGDWRIISEREELTVSNLESIGPRYVFFPHWSWKVPDEILKAAECVCFHMTDLPYGRGGSPLQNLILRGHGDTMVTALRMTSTLDEGAVYIKRPLSLEGRAQDIYERSADVIFDMISEIVETEPRPVEQEGEATIFDRRKPEQSLLPQEGGLRLLYDHIRMLDAETYPRAFLESGDYRLEFSDAELSDEDELVARVRIRDLKTEK